MSTIWVKGEIEFGTTFSYRQPAASAQFAIGSPIPSPATIKLALVDTAIRLSGSVKYGEQVFEWLKTCLVYTIPPECVVQFRVFLKRLKPREQELEESFGVRDYFLVEGPLTVFIRVPQAKAREAKELLSKIRALGTTDSLCWCRSIEELEEGPPSALCPRPIVAVDRAVDNASLLTSRFVVVRLADLTEKSRFEAFNPFAKQTGRDQTHQETGVYVLPLTPISYGETWVLLRREPLPIS